MGKDVELIDRDTVFEGYFRIDRYRLRHRLHQGGWSAPITREVFERGHAVAVLPYDPVRDEFVLIEQFRIGAYAADDEAPWLIEIVAGIIEAGESPETVARRETKEETGLEALDLAPCADFYVSPGGTTQFNRLFCARVDSLRAEGIHGLDHEHEDIRPIVFSAAAATRLIADGRVRDATTQIALYWLQANRPRLRDAWRALDRTSTGD